MESLLGTQRGGKDLSRLDVLNKLNTSQESGLGLPRSLTTDSIGNLDVRPFNKLGMRPPLPPAPPLSKQHLICGGARGALRTSWAMRDGA